MRFLKVLSINVVLFILFSEFLAFLYFSLGFSNVDYKPLYLSNAELTEQQWLTEFEDWGAWHLPNAKASFERSCITTSLVSNSYGARDKEREVNSNQSRVVVLGDSFAEGFGIGVSKRFSNILEQQLGKEFLNFGTSGNFGPVQYYILYKQLASRFDHDTVMIAFLPDNDFTDNDLEYWKKHNILIDRYRPYYKKTNTGFETAYVSEKPNYIKTFESMNKGFGQTRSIKEKIQRMTWLYGVYREVKHIRARLQAPNTKYSGYFDYTKEQLDASLYYLSKIIELAKGKKVILFTIPRLNDFRELEARQSQLIDKLRDFSKEQGVEYVDLTQIFLEKTKNISSLYIPCDGHWNEKGHALAANVLEEVFFSH